MTIVISVVCAAKAIDIVDYSLTESQKKVRDFCRTLYVVEDIKAG